MSNAWMVRSGGAGAYIELFEAGEVAIGWDDMGDMTALKTPEEIRDRYLAVYGSDQPATTVGRTVWMLHRFINVLKRGDGVTTYDPERRLYLVGEIASACYYKQEEGVKLEHRRKVSWKYGKVSRDKLQIPSKNTLGGLATVFALPEAVWNDLVSAATGTAAPIITSPPALEMSGEEEKRDLKERAHERLKDRIVKLDEEKMEELLAAVLRAMGFRTTVSPKGPDRGIDVLASPDGLGLQEPRIKAEVKHRKDTRMSAPDVRSFLGALRGGDRGIYLSTGGFSKEARYEAERAAVPVSLVDLDTLASLIETHYANFDTEGRALLPLTVVYWPADLDEANE